MPKRTKASADPLTSVCIVHTGAWPVPTRVYGIYRTREEAVRRAYQVEGNNGLKAHVEEVRFAGWSTG